MKDEKKNSPSKTDIQYEFDFDDIERKPKKKKRKPSVSAPESQDDSLSEIAEESSVKKINWHFVFLGIMLVLLVVAIIKLFIWNRGKDSEYDPNSTTTEFDTESQDYIQPLSDDKLAGHDDDGVTTILCLGNAPFSDNRGDTGLAQTLAKKMDATVIDASFSGSYLSMKNATYTDSYSADAFSLYPVVNAFCINNYGLQDAALTSNPSEDNASALTNLKSVDFEKVDMIAIMYDISDYTDLRPIEDPNNPITPITYNGSLNASIQLIQKTYPYIRIVVMSHPACGATIDGTYVDGDTKDLGNGTLVDYLLNEINTAMGNGVSIIDNYYGVINVDNRKDYIEKDYHINAKGIELLADRFATLIK